VRRLASQGTTVAVTHRSDRAAADALVGELRDNGWTTAAVTYAEITPTGRMRHPVWRGLRPA
jgi:NAD(P)-dependent dehydrogenase (short-subunit alcohol dehydrogenase family)